MKNIYLYIITIITSITFSTLNAQTENKNVTIITSGSGNTIEEAQQSALRSAIEQAFGAFISTRTEILNDQIVIDEMASVSSGNIKSYQIVNQDTLPNNKLVLTIESIVSIDQLSSFVQSKGINIEIKGGLFATNIKQQILNEQAEVNAISEMVAILHEALQISFDYQLSSETPQSMGQLNQNWTIPLKIAVSGNENLEFCSNYLINNLGKIALKEDEIRSYNNLNKKIFKIKIKYNNGDFEFYLRKEVSLALITSLFEGWNFYTGLFDITPKENSFEDKYYKVNQIEIVPRYERCCEHPKYFNLPLKSEIIKTYEVSVTKTLSQLEQLSGYSIKPKGLISKFENGGIVIPSDALSPNAQSWKYGKDYKMIVSIADIGIYDWETSKAMCNSIMLNGYKDWVLPTKEDLLLIHRQYKDLPFTNFYGGSPYWANSLHISPNFNEYAWCCYIESGLEKYENERNYREKINKLNVRPIRIIKSADSENNKTSLENFEFGDYNQWVKVMTAKQSSIGYFLPIVFKENQILFKCITKSNSEYLFEIGLNIESNEISNTYMNLMNNSHDIESNSFNKTNNNLTVNFISTGANTKPSTMEFTLGSKNQISLIKKGSLGYKLIVFANENLALLTTDIIYNEVMGVIKE